MSILRESRLIRNIVSQIKTAEPAIGKIKMNLLAKTPLRANARDVTDQQHPDHLFGINRRTPDVAVVGSQIFAEIVQINKPVY